MFRISWLSFLFTSLLLCCSCQVSSPSLEAEDFLPAQSGTIIGNRSYSIELTLVIKNLGQGKPEKQNIWVALIRDFPPYQELLSRRIEPEEYRLVTDELGNQYAEFDFSGLLPGDEKSLHFEYLVQVNELTYDLSECEGEMLDEFTGPELHIESANPQILSLAQELSAGKQDACQQLRAFYDYVASELVYSFNEKNWGAQAALGPMGADCTEYASLLVALSRAQGVPARYFEGLLYLEEGAENRVGPNMPGRMPTCRVLVGYPLDPTLGRSSINRETVLCQPHPRPHHCHFGREPFDPDVAAAIGPIFTGRVTAPK